MADAEKGVTFLSFPPVLHLQLMRFQYDATTDSNVKVNDRFEFPERLHLDEFLQRRVDNDPADYVLHAVLVHSGDNHGGHYVVYINPRGDGKWLKFDDDVVSRCRKNEAIEHTFGGHDEELTVRHSTNAYMLVYIRESHIDRVLVPVTETDIPESLQNRLSEERQQDAVRRQERSEAHLYMTIQVLLEDSFDGHQGNDLFELDRARYRVFRVLKTSTLRQFMETLSQALNYTVSQMRPWPFSLRRNQTFRPTHLDMDIEIDKAMEQVSDGENPWTIFVETANPERNQLKLPRYDKDKVLLFLKKYDARMRSITYCGHIYAPANESITRSLVPILLEKGNFALGTNIVLYEEVKPDQIEEIPLVDEPLETVSAELMDGDILVFQSQEPAVVGEKNEYSTAKGYFRELHNRLEVLFCNKLVPADPGFVLELSLTTNYDRLSQAVALHLGTDVATLQFFKAHMYKDVAGQPIKYMSDVTLKELYAGYKPKQTKKLYYQQLAMRVDELERKRSIKCVWLNSQLKEEKELVLYSSKGSCVQDLLNDALSHVQLAENGSAKLRLVEIINCKIFNVQKEDVLLECLSSAGTKTYRIEEIPVDELDVANDEMIVPVAHFHKEVFTTYGIPFFLRIKNNEPFSAVKRRIQTRLGVSDKEFEAFKFAIVVMGRQKPLKDEDETIINLDDFKSHLMHGVGVHTHPWLGLDHINKAATKNARGAHLEKAIKIHN